MNKEVDFLYECNKVLYWLFAQLPQDDPEKLFFDSEIKEYCFSNGITYNVDEILDKLAIQGLIEGRGKGFVRVQNHGRTFCRQGKTLVEEYYENEVKKQGEQAFATLTAAQLGDYKSVKNWLNGPSTCLL